VRAGNIFTFHKNALPSSYTDPPKKSAEKPESTTNKTEIFHSQRENEKHSPVGFLNFQSQEWEISTEKITVIF